MGGGLVSSDGKNRFFYKEKNNEAALGILLHKNPREKVLLPYSFSLFLD